MWWKCESSAARNSKILSCLAEGQPGRDALVLWWFAGLWSVEQLADGRCSDSVARSLVPHLNADETDAALALLVRVGLLDKTDSGYAIHDYLDHQPSARKVRKYRKQLAEAGRRGGLAKAKQAASDSLGSRQKPDEAKPCPDTDTDTDTDHPPSGENKPGVGAPGCSGPAGEASEATEAAPLRTWLTPYIEAYLRALNAWRAHVATGAPPATVGLADIEKTDAAAYARHISEAGKPPVEAVERRLGEWLATTTPGSAAGGFLRLRDFVSWHKRRALVPDGAESALARARMSPEAEARRRQHEDPNAAWRAGSGPKGGIHGDR